MNQCSSARLYSWRYSQYLVDQSETFSEVRKDRGAAALSESTTGAGHCSVASPAGAAARVATRSRIIANGEEMFLKNNF